MLLDRAWRGICCWRGPEPIRARLRSGAPSTAGRAEHPLPHVVPTSESGTIGAYHRGNDAGVLRIWTGSRPRHLFTDYYAEPFTAGRATSSPVTSPNGPG